MRTASYVSDKRRQFSPNCVGIIHLLARDRPKQKLLGLKPPPKLEKGSKFLKNPLQILKIICIFFTFAPFFQNLFTRSPLPRRIFRVCTCSWPPFLIWGCSGMGSMGPQTPVVLCKMSRILHSNFLSRIQHWNLLYFSFSQVAWLRRKLQD